MRSVSRANQKRSEESDIAFEKLSLTMAMRMLSRTMTTPNLRHKGKFSMEKMIDLRHKKTFGITGVTYTNRSAKRMSTQDVK